MKTFITIFISLLVLLMVQMSHGAVMKKYQYKVPNMGKLTVTAASKKKAFEVAANECFDKSIELKEARFGQLSEAEMLSEIDKCANLKW